jgi:superfamily II DNA or RNA helicase
MNTIYVYTTETYRDFRGWRKVGQTHQASAKMRVEQQDGTSNPEPLIIEKVFKVEDWISDHTIHAELVKMGKMRVRMDKDREWFECSVEDVATAINSIKFGISRPNSYSMRPEQQEGCDLLLDLYNKGFKKGLLNAKMRYGKCFTFYEFVKETGAKRAVILTYKPAVDASWYEDLNTHVDFDGWEYYHGRDFSNKDPFKFPKYKGKPQILFASFQDLIKNKDTNKWKNLSKYTFDAGARDEDHFGTSTDRAKLVLDKVKCNFWAHLSGTPLKTLMSGEFLDEEIYTWGYADEQAKRKLEKDAGWQTEIYRWLPVMKFHTFEVNEEAKKLTSCYTSEEGFTMTKMFGSEDGETFIDEAAVKLFLDQVFGIGVRKTQSPIRTHAVDHMLWVMPGNVKSVNALCKMLEKRVGDDYKILNVAGDNITKLEKVKQMIERNDKTITVTCGRFNTGVTVPEWDMVMMLDDGKSPESYFQTVFRVQSPDKGRGKEECYVVDFNPQRCLELVYEFADITAKKGQSTQEAVRTFLEFAPVLDHSGNTPVEVDVERVLNLMAETGGYAEKFGSHTMMNWSLIDNFADTFDGIDFDSNSKKSDQLADNDLENGKNYDSNGNNNKKSLADMDEKERQELRKKVITVFRRLPTYLFLEDNVIDKTEDIVYYNNVDLFNDAVGITLEDFKGLCSGFIKTDRLDRCIMAYNQIESM